MQGSMREKRPGGWEVRYRGRSRYVRGTKKDAYRTLRQLIGSTEDHTLGPSQGGPTVAALIERWLGQTAELYSPTTLKTYRMYVRVHVAPAIGDLAVGQVTTAVLNDLYRRLHERGLAAATIRQVNAIVRRAFVHGVTEGYGGLLANPAVNVTLPSRTAGAIRPPTPREVAKLLAVADELDPAMGVICRVAAASGARRGELCAIRWSDISGPSVAIRRSIAVAAPGTTVEKGTKTHQTRRVMLDPATAERVEAWRGAAAERCRLITGGPLPADGYAFTDDPSGRRPLNPDRVTAAWRNVCRHAGIVCRFHDLRHFVATHLLAAGVPVRIVSGRLGHKNASMTLDVYADWVPESDEVAAAAMGQILGGSRVDEA